jgi:hypothetical protein
MGAIVGLEGMSNEDLARELDRGGKFVVFQYTISVILMTFKRTSSVRFVRAGEGTFAASLPYSALTVLFGWWGIPWGPIYSVMSLFTNLSGGKNVTGEVLAAMQGGGE